MVGMTKDMQSLVRPVAQSLEVAPIGALEIVYPGLRRAVDDEVGIPLLTF
ncbi:hypothetical protein CCP3SC15_790012 [Gammaproteobacteria bacterium]